MKTALFLALSFLLWGSTGATDGLDPVLDISGEELRTGTDYYILPVIRGGGGGLTLASTGNETCPLDVVQEQLEVSNGLPLTFSPVNITKGVVRVSTDLNIKFSAATICVQSTVWKLDNDEATQKMVVTTGGVEGNPGIETLSNWFKIERYEDDYKLVFCPGVCDFCRPVCGDLGVFIDAGIRRLALSDVPLKVMFKRA
ncbi:Proteinase inhibitor I3 [Theobroma cacao]|uniref:Miraculin n=2 Tax=Theobroma cacao TaxID=3641 RepID=A0AB32V569_THECC|nr:PREDICTED: miraculin [Theobroma cacao]EOY09863.1 Kunitz family trypsin and protease inhibitor protein, putative [Theobroma cacao]WRX24240.1 Proteinase inhibitor I3 [Theobroma cacao]